MESRGSDVLGPTHPDFRFVGMLVLGQVNWRSMPSQTTVEKTAAPIVIKMPVNLAQRTSHGAAERTAPDPVTGAGNLRGWSFRIKTRNQIPQTPSIFFQVFSAY